jgi:hypothetical protein
MPKRFSGFTVLMCVVWVAVAATPVTKKSTTAAKSTAKSTKAGTPKAASKTGKTRRAVNQAPPRQAQPSTDRYREIQTALAEKGYLKSAPSGVWDQESMDAMRQFQQDQKLEPTGKLTSKSLIVLGLGPRLDNQPPPPVPPPTTPIK